MSREIEPVAFLQLAVMDFCVPFWHPRHVVLHLHPTFLPYGKWRALLYSYTRQNHGQSATSSCAVIFYVVSNTGLLLPCWIRRLVLLLRPLFACKELRLHHIALTFGCMYRMSGRRLCCLVASMSSFGLG
jgi:hypothetical protein